VTVLKNLPLLSRLALIIGFLAPIGAQAYSVKSFAQAAKGCIPTVTSDKAKEALKSFNIRTSNANPQEARTLGTALVWIEALNNGAPLAKAIAHNGNGYTYRFASAVGNSHQAANEVLINRNGGRNYGQNVAQLVHELGHFIGNNGAYDQYRQAMNGHYCSVSSYSNSRFNEQFAEVFAAFVTNPTLIKNNSSSGCRLAYQFFSKQLFANGLLADRCASHSLRPGVDF
jgi:hypothetical protein